MDDDAQQAAERVNEDMLLAAPDLLAHIRPVRIEPASIDDISHRARQTPRGSQAHGPTSGYDNRLQTFSR